jgi:hypothetical protein
MDTTFLERTLSNEPITEVQPRGMTIALVIRVLGQQSQVLVTLRLGYHLVNQALMRVDERHQL